MRIINLEDSVNKHMDILRVLQSLGETDITWVTSVEEGMAFIKENQMSGPPFDLAISDMHFPLSKGNIADWDAGEIFMKTLKEEKIELPVIICSSIRYRIPEAYGCIWYSELSDWEWELKELVAKKR